MSRFETGSINPLKPERIGLTFSLTLRNPLKPERIGQRLQKLPGWELFAVAETQAIGRGFRFHRTETAQAFASYVAHLAAEHGQQPVIAQSWNEVSVTLPGEGGVTDRTFDFAEVLMLLPAGSAGEEDAPAAPPEALPAVVRAA